MSWIPIYSGIVDSSLWDLSDEEIKIFLTMLAEKGPGDIYTGSAYALARSARKTEAQVLAAWEVLSGPDKLRKEKQAHDGARIQEVEGGWLLINAAFYRKKMSDELKRYRNAKAQKAWRERQAMAKGGKRRTRGGPLPGERAAVEHGVTMHEHMGLPDEPKQSGGGEGAGGISGEAQSQLAATNGDAPGAASLGGGGVSGVGGKGTGEPGAVAPRVSTPQAAPTAARLSEGPEEDFSYRPEEGE